MNDNIDKKIIETLDVMPVEKDIKKDIETAKQQESYILDAMKKIHDDELLDDFDFARQNLRRLILRAEEAYENASRVAEDSESPRAFEVVSQLLKTTLEANESLLNIHRQKVDIEKVSKPTRNELPAGSINIDKAVFTGTTADLQKFLEEQKNDTE